MFSIKHDYQTILFSLQALDGFVIVLTQDCELFYASETVQEYLGLSQVLYLHAVANKKNFLRQFYFHLCKLCNQKFCEV